VAIYLACLIFDCLTGLSNNYSQCPDLFFRLMLSLLKRAGFSQATANFSL